jgi:hypothetical protein
MSKKPGRNTKVRKPMRPSRLGERPMTSEDALAFIRRMQQAFPKRPKTKADKERLQDYLAQFEEETLKAVSQRVQGDLMHRPSETVRPEDFPKPPKPRRSPKQPSSRKKPRR